MKWTKGISHDQHSHQPACNRHRIVGMYIYTSAQVQELSQQKRAQRKRRRKAIQSKESFLGSRGSSVVKLWAPDQQVVGSNPSSSSQRIFFFRASFLCWLLFRCQSHPHVTAAARKQSWSFCQKCRLAGESACGRLQLNTHAPYACGFK